MHKYPVGQSSKQIITSKVGKCPDQVNLALYTRTSAADAAVKEGVSKI